MSGAEQFTDAVPERSGPRDWRGGLERRGARRDRVGDCRVAGAIDAADTAPAAREKYTPESRLVAIAVAPSTVRRAGDKLALGEFSDGHFQTRAH